jgi:hypothetical protein
MQSLERTVGIVCAVILLVVIFESLHPARYVSKPPPIVAQKNCVGSPIVVTFPFTGAVNDPWTCQVQCKDDKPRYVLYSNGRATQCDTPPSCLDYGEDHGITCNPPGALQSKSTSKPNIKLPIQGSLPSFVPPSVVPPPAKIQKK